MQYVSRWYQDEAHASIYDYFAAHEKGNPLICMPTGTGKSYVIARFVESVLKQWPGQRITMLTHDSRLIVQNGEKLLDLWPGAPIGFYSATLKKKQASLPITFAQIQSLYNTIESFEKQDLVLVDEAHMISHDESTRYRKTLDAMMEKNKKLRVIGLSATPYRLGLGMLTDGGLFTDIAYDITQREQFTRLIDEGFLCGLKPYNTDTILDLSGVSKSGGEYNQKQAQEAVNVASITRAAVQESIERAHDRRCWLVFTQGVEHAEAVAEMYRMHGQSAYVVHSRMDQTEVDRRILAHKMGLFKILVNANMLTTGFDNPGIDCIVMLRATTSTGLWVQMLGRGTRPLYAPGFDIEVLEQRLAAIHMSGKHDCLVLDFAHNGAILGPINDPRIPKKRGEGGPGELPVKFCETDKLVQIPDAPQRVGCGFWNHTAAKFCADCGAEFATTPKIQEVSSKQELIARDEEPVIQEFKVDRIEYQRWQKKGSPDSIHIQYYCGLLRFSEWISFDNEKAHGLSHRWWRIRFNLKKEDGVPPTTKEALQWIHLARVPVRIKVHVNRQYPVIKDHIFKEQLRDESDRYPGKIEGQPSNSGGGSGFVGAAHRVA